MRCLRICQQNEPEVLVTTVNPRQTSSVVVLSDIVAQGVVQGPTRVQRATRDLIELIVRKDEQKCRVIAVTGMGGIGKLKIFLITKGCSLSFL